MLERIWPSVVQVMPMQSPPTPGDKSHGTLFA